MKSPDRWQKAAQVVLMLIPALTGIWILWTSMHQGPGVGGDASIYITSAKNLIAGKGLGLINADGTFRLIPYFPPFYPLVLSMGILLGLSAESAAIFVNLVSFAGLIFLLTKQIISVSGSWIAGLLAGFLLAGSPILVPAYSWAMSEPLSLFLMAASIFVFVRGMPCFSRAAYWGSAVLAGLSFLTRYSMAVCILAICLVILVCCRGKFWRHLLAAVIYGLAAALPMIVWLTIDYSQTNTIASRNLLNNVNVFAEISRFFNQLQPLFLQWFLPDSIISSGRMPGFIAPVAAVMIIAAAFCALFISLRTIVRDRGTSAESTQKWLPVLLYSLFFILYLLQILLVSLGTFPPITIGPRMLLPAAIAFLVIAAMGIAAFLNQKSVPAWLKLLIVLGLTLFTAYNGLRGVRIARQNAIDGLGYNSVAWKNSETIAYLAARSEDADPVVTNEETALLYLLGRVSWPVRELYAKAPDAVYYHYADPIAMGEDRGRELFQQGKASLVIFDNFTDQMADLYGDMAAERVAALLQGLPVIHVSDDGTIYRMEPEP